MNNNQLLRTIVRNQYMVSTVRLRYNVGWDLRHEYETMVFKYDAEADKVSDWLELDCLRSPTEAEALISHSDMIFKWSAPE